MPSALHCAEECGRLNALTCTFCGYPGGVLRNLRAGAFMVRRPSIVPRPDLPIPCAGSWKVTTRV